jgi:hypothetical protein
MVISHDYNGLFDIAGIDLILPEGDIVRLNYAHPAD